MRSSSSHIFRNAPVSSQAQLLTPARPTKLFSSFLPILFLLPPWYNSDGFDPPEVNVSLVGDFIELITAHPGALVYHLVTLFAIQLIAGVALGHWQRQRDEAATRLLVMGLGLFLARVILMLLAVLDSVGLISSTIVFPPLERFLHLIVSVLVAWAFLPILDQNPGFSTTLLLVTALGAAGVYAAFAFLWPGAAALGMAYNGYWQERVWELLTTVVVGLAFTASLVWRDDDWGWLACLLTVWLAGHLLQLLSPIPDANTAGWVRLANLIALPLLAALTYRRALGPVRPQGEEGTYTSQDAVGILEAVQRIRTGSDLESSFELAAPSIARTLDADMAVVALLVPGPVEELRIVALHPTTVIDTNREPTLLLSRYPLLATASHGQRQEQAREDQSPPLMNGLYRRLGFDESGPMLVEPLVAGAEVLGLILVGNPKSRRAWDTGDEQMLQTIADVLASTIAGDDKQKALSHEQLARARDEAQRLASRAEDLESRLEQQRRRIEELSTRLRLREREAAEYEQQSAALAFWQEEVRELAEARDQLQAKLSQWQKRAERLSQKKTELEQ